MLSILCQKMTLDVLEGETQDAEWERAPAERGGALGALSAGPAHQPPGEAGRKAGARAGVNGGRKGRFTGSGDTCQHPDPIAPGGAPGSRDMLSRRWGGVGGWGLCFILGFYQIKKMGKL